MAEQLTVSCKSKTSGNYEDHLAKKKKCKRHRKYKATNARVHKRRKKMKKHRRVLEPSDSSQSERDYMFKKYNVNALATKYLLTTSARDLSGQQANKKEDAVNDGKNTDILEILSSNSETDNYQDDCDSPALPFIADDMDLDHLMKEKELIVAQLLACCTEKRGKEVNKEAPKNQVEPKKDWAIECIEEKLKTEEISVEVPKKHWSEGWRSEWNTHESKNSREELGETLNRKTKNEKGHRKHRDRKDRRPQKVYEEVERKRYRDRDRDRKRSPFRDWYPDRDWYRHKDWSQRKVCSRNRVRSQEWDRSRMRDRSHNRDRSLDRDQLRGSNYFCDVETSCERILTPFVRHKEVDSSKLCKKSNKKMPSHHRKTDKKGHADIKEHMGDSTLPTELSTQPSCIETWANWQSGLSEFEIPRPNIIEYYNHPSFVTDYKPNLLTSSSDEHSLAIDTDENEGPDEESMEARRKERVLLLKKLSSETPENSTVVKPGPSRVVEEESIPKQDSPKQKEKSQVKRALPTSTEVHDKLDADSDQCVATKKASIDTTNKELNENKREGVIRWGMSAGKVGNGEASTSRTSKNPALSDNCDDSDGYYRAPIDEILDGRYTVIGNSGKGMFSNVVRARDIAKDNTEVVVKIIRNSEIMHKAGLHEVEILKRLNEADVEDKFHCVRLYSHFYHKRHLCLVLEPLSMNLREVLKMYGKGNGINIEAVMRYTQQILVGLQLLKKTGIIHGDIKPDNIVVDNTTATLKLCDFGSATYISDKEITQYLVSRYYRAPEIILGTPLDQGVDIWSTACTIYELATGRIMFTGRSNNEMLKFFMDLKGKVPDETISKGQFKGLHFDSEYNFLYQELDTVTQQEKIVVMSTIKRSRDLQAQLAPSSLPPQEAKKVTQLIDLLEHMVMLDPNQRASVDDCLSHSFIQDGI